MNPAILDSFNFWIGCALKDLSRMPDRSAPQTRLVMIEMALVSVGRALGGANKLGCPARKAMCLRVMNWIAADMRRLPA